jgi:hypothetical protein
MCRSVGSPLSPSASFSVSAGFYRNRRRPSARMSALLSLEQTRETMRMGQLGQLCGPLASGVCLSTERIHRDQHDYAWTFSPWFLVLKGADTCRHSHAVAIERVSTQSLPKNRSIPPGGEKFSPDLAEVADFRRLETNPKRTKTPPHAGFCRKLTAPQTGGGSTVSLIRSRIPSGHRNMQK